MNKGLRRVSEILATSAPGTTEIQGLASMTANAGQILKLLNTILLPFRMANEIPPIDQCFQEIFVPSVVARLESCQTLLKGEKDGYKWGFKRSDDEQLCESVIFLARLVHFGLGFPGAWTPKHKSDGRRLLNIIFRLALVSLFYSKPLPHSWHLPVFRR